QLISGKSPFCETFFDDVRVEKSNLVGALNGGWEVAKYLLTHEREMIGAMGEVTLPQSLIQIAIAATGLDDQARLADPQLRSQIAEFELDEAAFQATLKRFGELAKARKAHPAMSSMLKYYGAELNKRRWELIMSAAGTDALEWESDRSAQGGLARTWLRTKGNSIEGGTSEVQLNVIAKRILELPGA
ncbi:MAG: acyl-CoA dehydrogenase, partial [Betaproteobacteria bacterium]|nr:acyl-CoA dehydrogenase [Betaproteobacteria bacterium]